MEPEDIGSVLMEALLDANGRMFGSEVPGEG